jgi:2-polyprenyl-3-methyl-5-hydroxy-6-metoxy-1,4-benzoquinol methylase
VVISYKSNRITFLSSPAPVSVDDTYYEKVGLDHFLARRRFDVLVRMIDSLFRSAQNAADIGCGTGLLQRQIEDHYRIPVTGIDLNEFALERNMSRVSPLYCYDIHDRSPEFRETFDLIFLGDVLEHIEDEFAFIESVKYHLAPNGALVVMVPAGQIFYSEFDRIVGHFRRYTFARLRELSRTTELQITNWTYWGLPVMPLLAARKVVAGVMKVEKVVHSGLKPPGGTTANDFLFRLSQCEWIPHKLTGTSLLAILQKH